jgi:hypothetical protein
VFALISHLSGRLLWSTVKGRCCVCTYITPQRPVVVVDREGTVLCLYLYHTSAYLYVILLTFVAFAGVTEGSEAPGSIPHVVTIDCGSPNTTISNILFASFGTPTGAESPLAFYIGPLAVLLLPSSLQVSAHPQVLKVLLHSISVLLRSSCCPHLCKFRHTHRC